jgi:hypothetical protein
MSHVDKRRNSPGMVANRCRSGFHSGVCASITTTIRIFLCTSIPAILAAIATSRRGSGRIRAQRPHTVTCNQPSQRDRGRNTDWFRHTSQTELLHKGWHHRRILRFIKIFIHCSADLERNKSLFTTRLKSLRISYGIFFVFKIQSSSGRSKPERPRDR